MILIMTCIIDNFVDIYVMNNFNLKSQKGINIDG